MSTSMEDYSIRTATAKDLGHIRKWLKREYDQGGGLGFWNNIASIKGAQAKGNLTVLVLLTNDKPIAFCVSSAETIDIFEVHPSHRGRHYGNRLARFVIEKARISGSQGLVGQCSPENSEPYWRRLGFKRIEKRNSLVMVAMPFRKSRELSNASWAVRIQLWVDFPEHRILADFNTRAELNNGVYLLRDEFVEYNEPDAIVTAWIDGEMVHSDKAKYSNEINIERNDYWIWTFGLRIPERNNRPFYNSGLA